jgi:hypothetical protein
VVPSEKYAACRGRVSDGMRMITPCFARAPQRCPSRLSQHFRLTFQEVMPVSKTRNQLVLKTCNQLYATPQQPYPANEGKKPQLHPGLLLGTRLKHPRNTEPIAGEEAHAKGDDSRMQIVHPEPSGQHHQQAHVHERSKPPRNGVAH